MQVRAAVWDGAGKPLQVTELRLLDPGPNEVLVRVRASGVCHTDLSVAEGKFPVAGPMVLGHEAAGVVQAIGTGVTRCRVGEPVVLSLIPQCGDCFWCRKGQPELCGPGHQSAAKGVMADGTSRFRRGDEPVLQFQGLGTFAEALVAHEDAVVPISTDIPLDLAALIGCAVLTGVGASLNTADIHAGDTVLVIGCGGVGLNVVQGARLAGAERILALDRADVKLELARNFGATETVLAGDEAAATVLALTGGRGVDVAFDVVGGAATGTLALEVVRRGGQVCLIGMESVETVLPVAVTRHLLSGEKKLFGSNYGSSDVRRDVPRILDRHAKGELLLEQLVGQRLQLDEIETAFTAMRSGELARSLIVFE